MRYLSLSVLLSVWLVPAVAPQASAQTLDEVVEKHLAALGGREALGKLRSRRATCTVALSSQGAELAGACELTTSAPNKTRLLVTLDLAPMGAPGKMILEQKCDGQRGWSLNSLTGNVELKGDELESMKNNRFPSTLLSYKEDGSTLQLLPGEQLNGRKMIVLRITPKTGPAVKMYLNAETFLTSRSVRRVTASEGGGEIESVSDPSDYRDVDGVKVPFRTVSSSPLQTVTYTFSKIEHNVAIDDAMFSVKAPAPVR